MDIPANNVPIIEDENGLRTQRLFVVFINDFRDAQGEYIYANAAAELMNPERNTLFVQFPDIHNHSSSLASSLELNFYKYYPFICQAIQQVVIEKCTDEAMKQRLARKEFYVSILNLPNKHLVRELTADKIGSLLRISGQVVRTHQVHPELCAGTFVCDDCGVTTRNIVQQFKYTPPNKCANPQCQNRSRFSLDVFNSQFVDFQRLRIQETQEELPRGCIPRNVEVIVRGEMVETAQPGDHCDFTGTLIVIPDVGALSAPGVRAELNNRARGKNNADEEGLKGLKSLGVRDLNYKMAFLACSITSSNPTFGDKEFTHEEVDHMELWNSMKPADQQRLKEMSEDKNIEQNLTNSLFPNIFGYDEIKLGILLMLFGGVPKRTHGISLRGDINVLMVGDPSCGKSQFLKTVEKFSPRVVYTSGKASSAAGLTAAVVKDEESFDFVIEAGALMLADNGVCCIDEFDKMDPKDQVAIHEAMEQQTISITKAGVKATLNARCSILAAANPINGRYDRSRTVKQNVLLTDPILSRFDLLFVLVDDPMERNEAIDFAIAKRILDNHTSSYKHTAPDVRYKVEEIRKYVMFAKCFKPKLSDESALALKQEYKKLRLGENNGMRSSNWRITVRQLESLIRLSEALARLHCDDKVTAEHVGRATRFLEKSIHRVTQPDIALDEGDDVGLDDQMEVDGEEHVLRERNASEEPGEEGDAPTAKKPHIDPARLKISFDVYKRISNLLVLHLRSLEEMEDENDDWEGIKQSTLVDWYLEKIEPDLTSVDEYHVQKTICERIIGRLVKDDNVLIQLNPDEEDPTLVVHPGYVVD